MTPRRGNPAAAGTTSLAATVAAPAGHASGWDCRGVKGVARSGEVATPMHRSSVRGRPATGTE